MDFFPYINNELHCEEVSLQKIAEKVGTPAYVYTYTGFKEQFARFDKAFTGVDHLVCYSMKANSNGAVLRTFIQDGAGMDVVSGGELQRALWARCDPQKIVYSGVGKTEEEMLFALKTGILQFNVEAVDELILLDRVASRMGKKAPVALRVNPNVDPKTHAYISTGLKKSKFGISQERALELYRRAKSMKGIQIMGIDCHIGSQLTTVAPFVEALQKIKGLVKELSSDGISLSHLDIGGGLGIAYQDENPPTPEEYAAAIKKELAGFKVGAVPSKRPAGKREPPLLILEPGRFLVGNGGILLTKVLYNKERNSKKFVIVDAASNDLMRPMLYEAYHHIQPVSELGDREEIEADIVGPVCETGDFFAQERKIQKVIPGEMLAILSAGAYGASMASNYNSRPRPVEVMVKGKEFFVVNEREKLEDLVKGEKVPEFLK